MDVETQIALENFAWKNLKINVPDFERLFADFTQHVSMDIPKYPTEVQNFMNGPFRKYLEPVPGFIRFKTYSRAQIEKTFGKLTPAGPEHPWFFRDEKLQMWWSESESFEFGMNITSIMFHGERPI